MEFDGQNTGFTGDPDDDTNIDPNTVVSSSSSSSDSNIPENIDSDFPEIAGASKKNLLDIKDYRKVKVFRIIDNNIPEADLCVNITVTCKFFKFPKFKTVTAQRQYIIKDDDGKYLVHKYDHFINPFKIFQV